MVKPIFELKTVDNKEVVNHLQKAKQDLEEFFGIQLPWPTVYLVDSRQQYDLICRRKTKNWEIGNAQKKNIYIMKDELKNNPTRFWKVLTHEYAHVASSVYSNIVSIISPRWFNEGLACYLADQYKVVLPHKMTKKWFDFYYKNKDEDIYSVGYHQVSWLIKKYGKQKLLKLLKTIKDINNIKDWDKMFYSTYKCIMPLPWRMIKKTKYFIFYIYGDFKPDYLYSQKCEAHVKRICHDFKFNTEKQDIIRYYIIPDKDIFKIAVGQAPYGRVYNQNIYSFYSFHPHEIAHVIFNKNLNNKPLRLLSEGIAVVYGWGECNPKWKGEELKFWVNKKNKISIIELIKNFHKFEENDSYPVSAIFVRFLINNFGISKFKKLYQKAQREMKYMEIDDIFKNVLGVSIKELNRQFYKTFI